MLTAAGSAAGIDLCLHIVRQDFGRDVANQVARRLVLPAHRDGGQAQFIARPVARERVGRLSALLDLLRERLNESWTIARMADAAALSERTLIRHFRDATGQSPLNWLIAERVERCKELLEARRTAARRDRRGGGVPEPGNAAAPFPDAARGQPGGLPEELWRGGLAQPAGLSLSSSLSSSAFTSSQSIRSPMVRNRSTAMA